jgi:hypothetical protein
VIAIIGITFTQQTHHDGIAGALGSHCFFFWGAFQRLQKAVLPSVPGLLGNVFVGGKQAGDDVFTDDAPGGLSTIAGNVNLLFSFRGQSNRE